MKHHTFIISLVLAACGAPIPAPVTDAPDVPVPDAPDGPTFCTADMMYCDKTDDSKSAVFQCNGDGTAGTLTESCAYGCAAAACFECDPGKAVCNGDALAMCGADGKVAGMTSCMNHGCQMDRCNDCTPSEPFCDGAASIACDALGMRGAATACGAKGCNPDTGICNACVGTGTSCVGDQLISCNNGDVMSATTCALGCSTTAAPHCREMTPLYDVLVPTGVDMFDLHITAANARLDITSCTAVPNRVTVNAPALTITGPPQIATVSRGTNPTICVVKFHSVTIDANAVLSILNSAASQVLTLESETSIVINGRINFRNSGLGPTRANAADVTVPVRTGLHRAPGAGGGGNALAGGAGGACVAPVCGAATVAGGAGGLGAAFSTAALLGGGKGGSVFVTGVTTANGIGGAGGGALHLVALKSVVVGITGKIDLSGIGGTGQSRTAAAPMGEDLPAGGGGAGGTLVIEAPAVTISNGGVLAANGGGGAGGCFLCNAAGTSCPHAAGQNGPLGAGRAVGGQCTSGGNGGSASNGVTPPSPAGQDSSIATAAGGGGGGSDGFIILRTRDAPRLRTTGAVISPAPQTGAVVAN